LPNLNKARNSKFNKLNENDEKNGNEIVESCLKNNKNKEKEINVIISKSYQEKICFEFADSIEKNSTEKYIFI
jgi:predicted metalloendopeptidase